MMSEQSLTALQEQILHEKMIVEGEQNDIEERTTTTTTSEM
jgi:hypothetical protein